MAVEQAEILKEAVETLRSDSALSTLLGGADRVFNHVPQDESKPYVVVLWEADSAFDTKDSQGYEGTLSHEAVTTHHGDRDVLKITDRIREIYNENPLELTSGRIICFDYLSGTVAVQVLETHHAIAAFNVLVDADGSGGAPIPPPSGGLIVVQDEGVDLANTPHKILNFTGPGVTATDEGSGEAEISVPGGGGGGGPDEFIVKSADESVANSTVLQDDDELKFSIAAGDKWFVMLTVHHTGSPGGGGNPAVTLRHTIVLGSGTPDASQWFDSALADSRAFGAIRFSGAVGVTDRSLLIRVFLDNTNGDATELKFRWAQGTSDATPNVVKKGSTLIAWKV